MTDRSLGKGVLTRAGPGVGLDTGGALNKFPDPQAVSTKPIRRIESTLDKYFMVASVGWIRYTAVEMKITLMKQAFCGAAYAASWHDCHIHPWNTSAADDSDSYRQTASHSD